LEERRELERPRRALSSPVQCPPACGRAHEHMSLSLSFAVRPVEGRELRVEANLRAPLRATITFTCTPALNRVIHEGQPTNPGKPSHRYKSALASPAPSVWGLGTAPRPPPLERAFFIDNLLVRIHFSIVMIRWTGLASWEFEFPFPGRVKRLLEERRGLQRPRRAPRPCI